MTVLSLSHRKNPRVHSWTLALANLTALLVFFTVSGNSALSAEEPVVVQQRITDEVHLIKVATDQHLSNERVGYLWARLASDYRKAGDFEASENAYMQAVELLEQVQPASRNYATALDN